MDRVKTSALSGAEIVVRCLQEEAVEYVFGYPGGAVLFIYDELFKQDKVKHVLVRHEQGAVHGADGYARSSQQVGEALLEPAAQGARRADQEGRSAPRGGRASADLFRRRRDLVRFLGALGRAREDRRLSDHQRADGPRRVSGYRSAVPRHAGHAWHL